MKKGLTEIVFILDRSGSMGGLESDVIGGFNSLIEKQKQEVGDAYVSTILFDDKYEVLNQRKNIKSVKPLTQKEYFVRGCTALLDAVGKTIDSIGKTLSDTPEEDRPSKVLFVITTDGYENASREYNYKKVKEMIEHQKAKYSWEFLFLGANIDASAVAESIGISADMSADFVPDGQGVRCYMASVSKAMSKARFCEEPLDASWKDEIAEDFVKRGKRPSNKQ